MDAIIGANQFVFCVIRSGIDNDILKRIFKILYGKFSVKPFVMQQCRGGILVSSFGVRPVNGKRIVCAHCGPDMTIAGIHKIKVEWPATKAFSEIGMNDSYRTIHPDEVSTPGYTWTPVPSEQEILDRLDFVLYSGCKVTDSFITGESEATSDVVVSPYPSDHRMVTSCFNF